MAPKDPDRRKPPRIVAFGFLFAFALSILTLIYTGLLVRAPGSAPEAPEPPSRTTAPETRPASRDAVESDAGESDAADAPTGAPRAADGDAADEATASGRDAGSRAPAD